MRRACTFLAVLSITCTFAHGWSTKEHIQLTRIAIERLVADPQTPGPMKQWLHDAVPGLMDSAAEKSWFINQRQGIVPRGVDGIPYWAVMPDMNALMEGRTETKIEPFGVS